MKPRHCPPLLLSLLIVAGAGLLSGCAPPTSRWSESQAPRGNTVDFIHLHHAVAFVAGSNRLAPGEAARLDEFLRLQKIGYGDRLTLLVGDGEPRLGKAREVALAKLLAGHGLQPATVRQGTAPQVFADQLSLEIGRYVVTPPACPDWSKPSGTDLTNTVGGNFGCATAANLGLMVADPGDLVQGREMGPGDAAQSVLGIQRYQAGKVIAPATTNTHSDQAPMSGGLGGGQ